MIHINEDIPYKTDWKYLSSSFNSIFHTLQYQIFQIHVFPKDILSDVHVLFEKLSSNDKNPKYTVPNECK